MQKDDVMMGEMKARPRPRRAFVSGGGSDLGYAIAVRLLCDGYDVTLSGRDQAKLDLAARSLEEQSEQRVHVRVCDVTDPTAVTEVLGREAPPHVLVLNAGVAMSAPIARTPRQDWDECFMVNATGPFLMLQVALPKMVAQGWGRIIAIGSTGSVAGARYTAAYSASKHALLGLIRVAASELMGTGVTANMVCPSFIDTAMTKRTVENIARSTGRDLDSSETALIESLPLGRLLRPDEVAAAVGFLASPSADSINGQTLVMDGGALQT